MAMDLKNAEMIIKKIYNWVTGDDANRFTGQKTSDKSISVVLASDGGGVNIGDVEIVDSNGDPLISQKIMDESLPVAIASDQSTLPVAGAVTNTVLTDIYDTVNHLIRVSIQNASIAVTGTFWQATQPVSGSLTGVTTVGTVTNDVGVKPLTMLDNGSTTSIAANPTAIAVPAGSEVVSVENQSTNVLCIMYVGHTNAVGAAGIRVEAGVTRNNIPCYGKANIYIHSTVLAENCGTQFYGRV